ncbi:MAG: deoxynucleoside kinase [Nitrospinae bacterium]|nr:deoxynucleoside kinase [Nitrospinota bacterium]
MKNKFIIGIGGPCGSGKSTFTKIFSGFLNIQLIDEPIPKDILDAFESNPSTYSFSLQEAIIKGKIQGVDKLNNSKTILFDRTIEEDREVFFKLHNNLGFLNNDELLKLISISKNAENHIGKLNKLILLTARPDILIQRIKNDNNHIRPSWLVDSMTEQIKLYSEWDTFQNPDNIKIDTSEMTIADLKIFAKKIYGELDL